MPPLPSSNDRATTDAAPQPDAMPAASVAPEGEALTTDGKSLQHSSSINAVADILLEQAAEERVQRTTTCANVAPPSPFAATGYADAGAGARVLFATDEWFAVAENLLKESPPTFDPDAYCAQGKVMDGWETRRRREPGHDWCLLRLRAAFAVHAVEVDTAHFTGNHAPAISLQIAAPDGATARAVARDLPGLMDRLLCGGGVQGTGATPAQVAQAEQAVANLEWKPLLEKTRLGPGYQETRMHYFTLDQPVSGTHVRVNYYPDGGVARLRLWGFEREDASKSLWPEAPPLYSQMATGSVCTFAPHSLGESRLPSRQRDFAYPELSSMEFGGAGLTCSNKHYGDPWNLIQPTLGKDMGDGWETARHPNRPAVWIKNSDTGLLDTPLMDWCVLKLGHTADSLVRIILDTKHFRGNYPESVQVDGCCVNSDDDLLCLDAGDVEWFPMISRCRLGPDAEHMFDRHQFANSNRKVSHVKISIYPDGGLSRVRVYGRPIEMLREFSR